MMTAEKKKAELRSGGPRTGKIKTGQKKAYKY
jgi:hypothetical protein